MTYARMIVAIYRHRGYRDASNGVPHHRNPGRTRAMEAAWLEGWNWFYVCDRPSREIATEKEKAA